MLPVLPNSVLQKSRFADQPLQFPPNLAGMIPESLLKEMGRDLYNDYILPQTLERMAYEGLWDHLLDMYRIKLKRQRLRISKDDSKLEDRIKEMMEGTDESQVSDSLIYDAVDRLKNLNHFISWKDGSPIQYNAPKFQSEAKEDEFYHPLADKIKSANGLLQWNIDAQNVYRKHLILSGHHYLYGCCFLLSELEFESKPIPKRAPNGSITLTTEISKIGVTFEPISIRKLWLNYRVSAYAMEYQPCPFFFEEIPRFAILQNQYDPNLNPFGFTNLQSLPQNSCNWLFGASEMDSFRSAIQDRLSGEDTRSIAELVKPEKSVEALWTFYPMLPFDPQTGEYKVRSDGSPVPSTRFIWQEFATNLHTGNRVPIRIQQNYYPMDKLPLYGSTHMPDMDSGVYGLSIGEILQNHYNEICTAMNQYVDNKNWINNPPSWYVIGSPCATQNRNKPGADIPVTGPNDFGWRTPYDATATTINMIQYLRDTAQTTSKAVDAILGKALGGRTSATEAQNVFQAAMSGVTTDINLFNYDVMGGYAERVWTICGLWFDEDLIKAITGQYGPPLTLEDLHTRVSLKWDVGSTYIESIVKQGHLRYALETGARSQALRQDILWRGFFQELRLPELQEAVIDGGFAKEVERATLQSCETYLGKQIAIDPMQNHQIAAEVKLRFLQDVDSNWNREYAGLPSPIPNLTRSQYLSQQFQLHQQFAILQQQQQQLQIMEQMQIQMSMNQKPSNGGSRNSGSPAPTQTAGQVTQSGGQL